MFNSLPATHLDALVRVGQRFRADSRPEKMDLGVGVYRDAEGVTGVLNSVKAAEQFLQETQSTKSYLPSDGEPEFVALMVDLVLGGAAPHVAAAQAPGGTGAFHQALALIKATGKAPTIWVGTPTWPNHIPMILHQGLKFETYGYYDVDSQSLRFGAMIKALKNAKRGDLFLLHGCCHNPTGADLNHDQWTAVGEIMLQRGVLPLIDFAYQGFGHGLDEDAAGVRTLAETLPRVIIAASCSKSFSLYQERTGVIIVKCENGAETTKVRSNLQLLARLNFSNPPGHGAAIVRTILTNPTLRENWLSELQSMRQRVCAIRQNIATLSFSAGADLQFLRGQSGLFATFSLDAQQCDRLGTEFAIHMPDTGRVNFAGLNEQNVKRFVEAINCVRRK